MLLVSIMYHLYGIRYHHPYRGGDTILILIIVILNPVTACFILFKKSIRKV